MQTIFGPEHDGMGGQRTSGNSMRRMLRGIACLALLATGDPGRPLVLPGDPASRAAFARVREDWAALRDHWQALARAATGATDATDAG